MKIFLSHTNRDKPLVNAIKKQLPLHIKNWIDENDLLWGEGIEGAIQKAIEKHSDYVLVFLGKESINSEWVLKELQLALEHEKRLAVFLCYQYCLIRRFGQTSNQHLFKIENTLRLRIFQKKELRIFRQPFPKNYLLG